MKEVTATANLDNTGHGARRLDSKIYSVYSITDKSQVKLYQRLAALVEELDEASGGGVLIESLAPQPYEDGEYYFSVMVTVAI